MTNSIPHILNLVCLAKTGQQLPSSLFGENRWRYKKEGDKKIAIYRGVPDLKPTEIPDDPEFRIPRLNLVKELEGIWYERDRHLFVDEIYGLFIVFGVKEYLWHKCQKPHFFTPQRYNEYHGALENIVRIYGEDCGLSLSPDNHDDIYAKFHSRFHDLGFDDDEKIPQFWLETLWHYTTGRGAERFVKSEFYQWIDNLNFHKEGQDCSITLPSFYYLHTHPRS